MNIKLQKLIAIRGFCSRRKAETLIKNGNVFCNGICAKIGQRVPLNCIIKINNELVQPTKLNKIYLILNKPIGYISSNSDTHNRKTVIDLVKNYINQRLFIVGRLDFNSHGLILLTNDGEITQKLMHPKFEITKTYEVVVNRKLSSLEINKLTNGVYIKNNNILTKTAPAKIKSITSKTTQSKLIFEIHEGKNRQIRKMVATLPNAKVIDLKRTKIGPISLGNLKSGQWRPISSIELKKLYQL